MKRDFVCVSTLGTRRVTGGSANMVINTTTSTTMATAKPYYQQEQAKKRQSIDNSMIRFPKLDECAHFHYEFAELVSALHLAIFSAIRPFARVYCV